MTEQYTEFQKRAIESVKRIWRLYVVNLKPEELESSLNCRMIGMRRSG